MPRTCFKTKYEGKMPNRWHKPVYLSKSNVKCQGEAVGIWGELERDDVKNLKDLIKEWVKGKENPAFKITLLMAIKPTGGRCGPLAELDQRAEFPNLYSQIVDENFPFGTPSSCIRSEDRHPRVLHH